MLSYQNCYGLNHISNQNGMIEDLKKESNCCIYSSSSSGSKSPKRKSEEASKRHAVAEQKRRERINRHFDTLRKLFPTLTKTDKASVLAEAVRHLRELRTTVADKMALLLQDSNGSCTTTSTGWWSMFLPSECDEATVSYCEGGEGMLTVKATICCEDRPSLNKELKEAVRSVKGKTVKAEMATVGGRTKVVVLVEWREAGGSASGCGGGAVRDEPIGSLRRALKAVVENRALGFSGLIGPVISCNKGVLMGSL